MSSTTSGASRHPEQLLASYRTAGATHVLILTRDYENAPPECRHAEGTVLPIELAEDERFLPLSPNCCCYYAPLVVQGLGPNPWHAFLNAPLQPVRRNPRP